MKQVEEERKKRLEEEERRNLQAAVALAADEGAAEYQGAGGGEGSADGPVPPALTADQIAEQTRLLVRGVESSPRF